MPGGKDHSLSVRSLEAKLASQRQLLARLIRSGALSAGDITTAFERITEIAAETLGVDEASIWRLSSDRQILRCVNVHQASNGSHERRGRVSRIDAPSYFEALDAEKIIAVPETSSDPRCLELLLARPTEVSALLDAPVFVRGELAGMVCHVQQRGSRDWELWEELIAKTVADFISLVIEAGDRLQTESELRFYRKHLETIVEDRTNELELHTADLEPARLEGDIAEAAMRQSEEDIRNLFAAAPVPMVLTRDGDGQILLANEKAARMFELPQNQLVGLHAEAFYVQAEDRRRFLQELGREGSLEGFEAPLRSGRGTEFWVLISAHKVFLGQPCLLVGFVDVTDRKRAEAAVRRSEENLRNLFNASPTPLVLVRRADDVILLANKRAAAMLELELVELIGKKGRDFALDPQRERVMRERLTKDGFVENVQAQMKTSHGTSFWSLLSIQGTEFEGEPALMIGFADVTAQKDLEDQLRTLAEKDPLTQTYNRRSFMLLARRAFSRAQRNEHTITVAMVDADHFKDFNDRHGHDAGDEVLKRLAETCRQVLRKTDVLGRYGGEEFVILLDATRPEDALRVLERLRASVETAELPSNVHPSKLTVSIGFAGSSGEDVSFEDVLKRADVALYRAKQTGRNRVVLA